jgi:REP element-mobilizing transposase RayT
VINAGRRRRLFDNAVRDVLKTLDPRCSWLGCMVRAAVAQLDHLHSYAQGGPTDAANARIACKHHNLFKHRNGYQPQRAPDGTWQLHRPNGTPLAPPDAA